MKSKTFIIAQFEFLKTVKRKAFVLSTLLLPLIMALPLLFSSIPSLMLQEEVEKKIGFIDHADFLESNEEFQEYPGLEDANQAFIHEEIPFFFVVPENYLKTGKITLYLRGRSLFDPPHEAIHAFLTQNLLRYTEVEEGIVQKINQPPLTEEVFLDTQGHTKEGEAEIATSILPMVLLFLLVIGILTSSGYLMEGIGEEKESRTGELLLSSVSAGELLKGKILGYGGASLLQMVIWVLLGFLLVFIRFPQFFAGVSLSPILGLALLYFLLGYFLFATSIACAASIASTTKEAQQTSMIFTFFAILPLMFSSILMMNPNSMLNQFLTYFPYTAPFISLMRFSLREIAWYEIAISLAVLTLCVLLLAQLSGKIFRMGMLMYGKKASLREVIGFLKEK